MAKTLSEGISSSVRPRQVQDTLDSAVLKAPRGPRQALGGPSSSIRSLRQCLSLSFVGSC